MAVGKILINGATGRIGRCLWEAFRGRYDLRITSRRPIEGAEGIDAVIGEITDRDAMLRASEGIHTLIHMAANPSANASFEDLLQPNIIGLKTVYQAAVEQGVKRIIFASSIHAVGATPMSEQSKPNEPVRPCCDYGTTKCYGEALLRRYVDRDGISGISIRIGAFGPYQDRLPTAPDLIDMWISPRDMAHLTERCVVTEGISYLIINGLSNNRFNRLDIANAREVLGYEPQDDGFTFLKDPTLLAKRRPLGGLH
jgi:nucleoside-diphosphate-sugar epimerase